MAHAQSRDESGPRFATPPAAPSAAAPFESRGLLKAAPSAMSLVGCVPSTLPSAAAHAEAAPDPLARLRTAVAARIATGQIVHLNMVVLLADFRDRAAQSEAHDPAYYRDLLFSHGTHPTGSMADYYFENSNGRVQLDGEVLGWFRMPERYDAYVAAQAGLGIYPFNTQGLVEDAVRAADRSINYARFDNDGPDRVPDTFDDDQMIDLLLVIHAGSGGEAGGARNLRSIAFFLPSPTPFDGVFANPFAIAPEDANMGVFAHETGHLFGLPDLYDMTGGSFGLGTWSLMAGGWSLDEARTPAHLDAWCKAQLGFLTPINVAGSLENQQIDPVERGGAVYRLAPGGALGREYFLVENRLRTGFDRFLPGDGLAIYHVNEGRLTNNIPLNYRVGLEQADGLFQLENLDNGLSFGDAGDLWTEDSPSRGFGRFTVPDSRLQSGQETGITVYRIHGPDPSGRITADFRVQAGPTARIEALTLAPVAGDGDAFAEPGETFSIRPRLVVSTGTVHDVVLRVRSDDPLVRLLDSEISLGDLPVGTHAVATGFVIQIGDGLPYNPYGAELQVEIDYRDEVPLSRGLVVALGDAVGFEDDFDAGLFPWPHRAGRLGYYDLWRPEPTGGRPKSSAVASGAWHCGNPTQGFRGDTDAILETPLFILPQSAHLIVDQLLEVPPDDSGDVIAGGFVEISQNGGDWTSVAPTRGYDHVYNGADRFMSGRAILSRDTPGEPAWETLDFDLSQFSGGARLRFRFFAAATIFIGKGWWIDNLRVVSSGTPVVLTSLAASRSALGALLEWTLSDPTAITALSVYRVDAGGQARLTTTPLVPRSAGSFFDSAAPPGDTRYRLEAVERSGAVRTLGEIWLAAQPDGGLDTRGLAVRSAPNPTSGATQFSLTSEQAGPVRLVIFDARGRLVRTLLDEVLPAGVHACLWNGRDLGGRLVPAGIYLYRLEASGRILSRKLVVSR